MQKITFYILLIISLTACYDDLDLTEESSTQKPIETTMDSGVTGRAIDQNGEPFTEYNILVNGQTYASQSDLFYHEIKQLRKYGQIIYLEVDNEIKGFSNSLLIENDINYETISAFPDKTSQSLVITDEELINLDNSISIKISKDNLLNTQNVAPSDNIELEHLVFSNPDLLSQVGNVGYSQENELLVIDAQSVFYLNPLDINGDALSVNAVSPIVCNINSNASLFHLDESDNYWQEVYNGFNANADLQLLETGYYMIATAQEGVFSEGEVVKSNQHISYLDYSWKDENLTNGGSHKSTANGKWAICSSPSSDVTFDFMTPCDENISSASVQISDTELKNYTFEVLDEDRLSQVVTQVFDCNGNVTSTPAVTIIDGPDVKFVYVFRDGEIDTWLPVCQSDFLVTGFDLANIEEGPQLDWNTGQADALGYLTSCNDFSEDGFSFLKIREDVMVYNPATIQVDGLFTKVLESEQKFLFDVTGTEKGSYMNEEVRVVIEDRSFGPMGYRMECSTSTVGCGMDDFTISHLTINGDEWTRISFSGSLWMQTIQPALAGDFEAEGVIMTKM